MHYANGVPDGLWLEWYENGQKELEYSYVNGKKDGNWTVWYENGNKKHHYFYVKGKKSTHRQCGGQMGTQNLKAITRPIKRMASLVSGMKMAKRSLIVLSQTG